MSKFYNVLIVATPEKVKKARQAVGLTQTKAAAVLRVKLRTWQRWEAGEVTMPPTKWELFLIKTEIHPTYFGDLNQSRQC